jgi:hypothetical protein
MQQVHRVPKYCQCDDSLHLEINGKKPKTMSAPCFTQTQNKRHCFNPAFLYLLDLCTEKFLEFHRKFTSVRTLISFDVGKMAGKDRASKVKNRCTYVLKLSRIYDKSNKKP